MIEINGKKLSEEIDRRGSLTIISELIIAEGWHKSFLSLGIRLTTKFSQWNSKGHKIFDHFSQSLNPVKDLSHPTYCKGNSG